MNFQTLQKAILHHWNLPTDILQILIQEHYQDVVLLFVDKPNIDVKIWIQRAMSTRLM